MENAELIKALKEDAEWAHGNEWETPITLGDHLDAAAAALEAADKAQRWIPVSERLPEIEKTSAYEKNRGYFYHGTCVLVTGKNESGNKFVGTDMLIKFGDEKAKFSHGACIVTHWQPLPLAPKGE